MTILLLEDETEYNDTISEYLQSLGYEIDSFEDGDEALDAIYDKSYHLLLLDIKVPGMNGHEIVKTIREDNNEVPVIFITSLTDVDDLSIGYELGCNDYIRKPFASMELKYRIEQVLKLFYFHSNRDLIELNDGYTYEIKTNQIFIQKQQVNLTPKEQKVWEYLISRIDQYTPTKTIWEDVWEGKMVSEAEIRMVIKKIRNKTSSNVIISHKGLGYKIARKR